MANAIGTTWPETVQCESLRDVMDFAIGGISWQRESTCEQLTNILQKPRFSRDQFPITMNRLRSTYNISHLQDKLDEVIAFVIGMKRMRQESNTGVSSKIWKYWLVRWVQEWGFSWCVQESVDKILDMSIENILAENPELTEKYRKMFEYGFPPINNQWEIVTPEKIQIIEIHSRKWSEEYIHVNSERNGTYYINKEGEPLKVKWRYVRNSYKWEIKWWGIIRPTSKQVTVLVVDGNREYYITEKWSVKKVPPEVHPEWRDDLNLWFPWEKT